MRDQLSTGSRGARGEVAQNRGRLVATVVSPRALNSEPPHPLAAQRWPGLSSGAPRRSLRREFSRYACFEQAFSLFYSLLNATLQGMIQCKSLSVTKASAMCVGILAGVGILVTVALITSREAAVLATARTVAALAPVAARHAPGKPQAEAPVQRAMIPSTKEARTADVALHQKIEDAPAWAIGYGKEFWRRPAANAQPRNDRSSRSAVVVSPDLNLGDVIERVSHAITQDESAPHPQARTKTYTAAFDGHGLRFSPHRLVDSDSAAGARGGVGRAVLSAPLNGNAASNSAVGTPRPTTTGFPKPDPATEAVFRTVSIRQGDHTLYVPDEATPTWSLLGNTAQALLESDLGLVEHYETRAEGVAVTWVFAKRLPGADSLTVEAELTGLTYTGQTDRGHHFADATGTARLRVGQTKLVDATGRQWDLATRSSGDHLRVEVPAALLAQASYPLAIDPVIGPEFGLDAPVILPALGQQDSPAVASNGHDYLVVWSDHRRGTIGTFGARVSEAGQVLDPGGIEINTSGINAAAPTVASNGTEYFVVWADNRNWGRSAVDLYGARVTSTGIVMDPEGVGIGATDGRNDRTAIASDGKDYFVVWCALISNKNGIAGARVSDAGQLLDTNAIPVASEGWSPAVAPNGSGYFVVWAHNSLIAGARVSGSGTVIDSNPITICSTNCASPAVASNGEDYLVIWEDFRNYADIYGARVSGAGSLLDTNGLPIGAFGGGQFEPKVAWNGKDYLVVWTDHRDWDQTRRDIYGARVSEGGTVREPGGFPITTAVRYQDQPSVASNGTDFFVAWRDQSSENDYRTWNVWGARVTDAGSIADPNGIQISTSANNQMQPAVAFNGTHYLAAWVDGFDYDAWINAFSIRGVRLDINGSVVDPSGIEIGRKDVSQLNPAIASNGTDFLVVWSNTQRANNAHAARVSRNGTVLDLDEFAVSRSPAGGAGGSSAAASDGSDYLVVWEDSRNGSYDIYGARVSRLGVVSPAEDIPICRLASKQAAPSVAFLGNSYLVVWEDYRNAKAQIFGTLVSTRGVVVDTNGFLIGTSSKGAYSPSVAANGADYFVAWEDYRNGTVVTNTDNGEVFLTKPDIFGSRVSATGSVSDTTGIAVCAVNGDQSLPAVTASGGDFLVVWQDERHVPVCDLYGARVSGSGTVLDQDGFEINRSSFQKDAPKVAGGNGGQFLVVSWGFRAEPFGAYRAVGNFIYPDPAILLGPLVLSGGNATLTWNAQAGKSYRAQFKPGLSAGDWADLPGAAVVNGATATYQDTTLGSALQRYYRVREE